MKALFPAGKVNPHMPLTSKTQVLLKKLKELNLNGDFILMNEGNPLTAVTSNRHLKECYKNAVIPYRISHKIRFSVASSLYAKGELAPKIQKLLGHSTLAMTLHYLRDITQIVIAMSQWLIY